MSYSRRYVETVSRTVSVNYSFPASEHGGSDSTNVTVEIPVTIDIDVDTDPFDRSVNTANRHINLLTGSVIAAESAHIAAKIQSSQDISDSIIDGFFGLIKSEINQQLTEIKPRVEALLVEMIYHQEACISKKEQLQIDFNRIAERYGKIFIELDKELKNRVRVLNQSAMAAHEEISSQVQRTFSDNSTGISTIFNKEGGDLQSMLYATGLKSRALLLIDDAKSYLFSEKNLAGQLQRILTPSNTDEVAIRHVPVLYVESKNASAALTVQVISSPQIPSLNTNSEKLKWGFSNAGAPWKPMKPLHRERIGTYLNLQVAGYEGGSLKSNERVSKQIMHLWSNDNDIKTLA